MPKRNEHVVAIILEPAKVGYEFTDWPLHITIVPWFPCNDERRLDKILEQLAKTHTCFEVNVGGTEKFGPNRNVPVNLIDESEELTKLHWTVFKVLQENNFGIHQKEFIGEGYRAHISQQKHGKMNKGQKLKISSFTLVKQVRLKRTGTMVKTIVKNYELG